MMQGQVEFDVGVVWVVGLWCGNGSGKLYGVDGGKQYCVVVYYICIGCFVVDFLVIVVQFIEGFVQWFVVVVYVC